MKKKLLVLALALVTVLAACGGNSNETPKEAPKENAEKQEQKVENTEKEKIVLGVTPVPHGEIIEALKPEFEKAGLDVEVVTFDEYVQPNLALADGDLDANFFQHEPYLDTFKEEHNLDLVSIGAVHVESMAVYSEKYKSLEELPEGAEILIPNDPTNGARALLLLANEGLIDLKDKTNIMATESDITANPKKFVFTPIDAANIARTYTDVDAGIINANYAMDVGLNPEEDSILMEGKESPYANIVAVRNGEENEPKFKKLMEVLNSEACREFIKEEYKGTISVAF